MSQFAKITLVIVSIAVGFVVGGACESYRTYHNIHRYQRIKIDSECVCGEYRQCPTDKTKIQECSTTSQFINKWGKCGEINGQ